MNYKDLLKSTGLNDKDILNVYQYGSRVYNTVNINGNLSDWDFIIVMNNKKDEHFICENIDIIFYTPMEFETKLLEHGICILECYFLPEYFIWKEILKFSFILDKQKLRKSLSAKSDNSFAKAHKKLTVEKDYNNYIAKKSLFHSFRIIDYGIQLAEKSSIYNFSSLNNLYHEILTDSDNWDVLFKKYKPQYNKMKTKFREVAPK
jgi:hypothetical protein